MFLHLEELLQCRFTHRGQKFRYEESETEPETGSWVCFWRVRYPELEWWRAVRSSNEEWERTAGRVMMGFGREEKDVDVACRVYALFCHRYSSDFFVLKLVVSVFLAG